MKEKKYALQLKFTIFEILLLIKKLGCLKLTYRTNNDNLKVAYSSYKKSENNRAECYRYGFNGKENDNEVSGNGNSVDFGERMYDPRLGRMRSIDRYADKYPYMSPYSYAGNNPIAAVDIAGDSLYVLFHVSGNGHGDDMFKAAALTRQYDIEHSGHFDPSRDKVVVLSVQNMSDIKAKPSKQ